MSASESGTYSFQPLERSRQWTRRFAILSAILLLVTGLVMALAKHDAAKPWRITEGLLMVSAAFSCFACAFGFIRQANFRCPRCGKPFFKSFASGDKLYDMASSCQ